MTVFFSQLINGLSLGSIYALIALGYSMVYGIILLLNFAHGDVIMVGAYMSWFVMNQLGLGPVTAVCATIITCTLLGVVIEKVAYTPLRNAPRISLLITAIGVSFFLEYTAELVMGSGAKVIPSYYGNKTFMIGSVPLGLTSVITLVVTVLSMLVLTFLVQKTKLGKAMRAVSEDMGAAQLQGEWTATVAGQPDAALLQLGPHPEWKGTDKGTVERAGTRHAMVGDVNRGAVTLEESANGINISGTWLGEVDPASCGREIRGDYLRGEDDPPQPFVLRKQASPAAPGCALAQSVATAQVGAGCFG